MDMRLAVLYTPYATSLKEKTGNIITFTQFEEGRLLSGPCDDAEIGEKSDAPSAKVFLRYLCWNLKASKRIYCVCTKYKEDNIFI